MAHEDPFLPKGSLELVMGMVGFALVVVTVAMLMDAKPAAAPIPEDARQVALITFADADDGGIVITSDEAAARLPPDGHGFIRGVLRALARERQNYGMGPDDAFVLVEKANGSLSIADPMSGTVIDLRAFGQDNERSFAALMPVLAPTTASLGAPQTRASQPSAASE